MTSPQPSEQSSTAVWYFIGATFVGTIPLLLFPESPWWVRLGLIVAAFVLIVVGFRQLRVERRRQTDQPPA